VHFELPKDQRVGGVVVAERQRIGAAERVREFVGRSVSAIPLAIAPAKMMAERTDRSTWSETSSYVLGRSMRPRLRRRSIRGRGAWGDKLGAPVEPEHGRGGCIGSAECASAPGEIVNLPQSVRRPT
jgi:hypothetical protein